MLGKYFFHKTKRHFYQPGEEINVGRNKHFCERDYLNTAKSRVVLSCSLFFIAYCILSFRLFHLCVIQATEQSVDKHIDYSQADPYEEIMEYTKSSIKRADIVDRNGTIIATSLPTVDLHIQDVNKIKNKPQLATQLAEIFTDMPYDLIMSKLKRKRFTYIKRNITPSQQYLVNALGVPGLDFEDREKRIYPHKNLFAHVIGRTNIDNVGISGLEKQLNDKLTESSIPLALTIDAGIQDTIREELASAVNYYRAKGASAILMNVDNGEILSMVSLPDFDPNLSSAIPDRASFNYATLGVYEPGSVLKIFNAALGLESGKVKVSDKFDATKPFKVNTRTIRDYRGKNRWLDLSEILIHSSNIGSARIALKVGKDEQKRFLQSLGFFEPVHSIEITEKGKPMIPSNKKWSDVTTASVGYGYGISVTPLHLISAFASVVNGGVYHEPTLIKNKETKSHRVLSYNTSVQMRKLLRNVVVEGSGKKANVNGYEVAGKTGTAEIWSDGKYVSKKVNTTFLATFPASQPKYALFLMMEEPKATEESCGIVTSGWNTVPTAGKIISAIAPQLDLPANDDIYETRRERIIDAAYTIRKK